MKLRSIISLTIIGHPTGEIEEALFKLIMEMEERGKNEGKRVEKVDMKAEDSNLGESPWLYKIQIKDKDAVRAGQPGESLVDQRCETPFILFQSFTGALNVGVHAAE